MTVTSRRSFLTGAAKVAGAGAAVATGAGAAVTVGMVASAKAAPAEEGCTCAGYSMNVVYEHCSSAGAHTHLHAGELPSHEHSVGLHTHAVAVGRPVPNGTVLCRKCLTEVMARGDSPHRHGLV